MDGRGIDKIISSDGVMDGWGDGGGWRDEERGDEVVRRRRKRKEWEWDEGVTG